MRGRERDNEIEDHAEHIYIGGHRYTFKSSAKSDTRKTRFLETYKVQEALQKMLKG